MTDQRQDSDWYLDEPLMWAFIRQGGNSPEHQAKKRKILEQYIAAHPLREDEEIGYIHVEAPLGAERMRWMFRTPELRYLPFMLPQAGEVRLVDDPDQHEETVRKLEDLSPGEFLQAALNSLLVLRSGH